MGPYICPDCFRPEGEMHKSGCRFDEGENLVDLYEHEWELQQAWEAEQLAEIVITADATRFNDALRNLERALLRCNPIVRIALRSRYKALFAEAQALVDKTDRRGRFIWWHRGVMSVKDAEKLERIIDDMQAIRETLG